MKKLLFITAIVACVISSCTQDSTEQTEQVLNLSLSSQIDQWKSQRITSKFISNQKTISHYEFSTGDLSSLIADKNTDLIWFDVGVNQENGITFVATAENEDGAVLGQVNSNIIRNDDYNENFIALETTVDSPKNIELGIPHLLENKDAYKYIVRGKNSIDNLEEHFTIDGQRIERFGIEPFIIQRILNTHDITKVALFLGLNNKQKITTVLMAKDKQGMLIIDSGENTERSGRAWDFVRPCPPQCGDPGCGGCAQYCESPWWMCCIAEPPCDPNDD